MELMSLGLMLVVWLVIERMVSAPVRQPVRILDRESEERVARWRDRGE